MWNKENPHIQQQQKCNNLAFAVVFADYVTELCASELYKMRCTFNKMQAFKWIYEVIGLNLLQTQIKCETKENYAAKSSK